MELSYSNKYYFFDFTIENYNYLLELAKENFGFVFFDDIKSIKEKTIILRHDVEFSVPIALEMAKIENSLGIKSTYFVQLHADFYNALEKRTYNQLKEIELLGHSLELHFDVHFWEINNEKDLEKHLRLESQVFKTYFNKEPKVFSFHNTNKFTLSCEKDTYAGLINVYSKKFKENYGYCADSTGYWRYERLEDRLKEAKDRVLQVLIHDGMWQNEVLPPRRRIYKVIDDSGKALKKHYDETLKNFGAKNIDWEGEV